MRVSRLELLGSTGVFHKTWHAHDREYPLDEVAEKRAYEKSLVRTYVQLVSKHVVFHSFSLMDNHAHETGRALPDEDGSLREGIASLGDWMRNAHSRFGQWYNRKKKRRGKVAYDRPHTSELEGDRALQRAMFYGDANPVRAGMVKHPSQYPHSSYRYYAYGEKSELAAIITEPDWYLALGKTRRQRQKKYRRLVDRYLREAGLLHDEPLRMEARFVGSTEWIELRRKELQESRRARAGPGPGDS